MDRRSWPWKKKSSDKAAAEKAAAAADSFATEAEQVSSVMISFSASLSIDQDSGIPLPFEHFAYLQH